MPIYTVCPRMGLKKAEKPNYYVYDKKQFLLKNRAGREDEITIKK